MNWIALTSLDQWNEILNASANKNIAIFKHSTRCGISSFVLKKLERSLSGEENLIKDIYFLDLIQYREVSNAIAEQLSIRHESPQLIVIENRKAIYHASHQSIDGSVLLDNSFT